MTKFFRSDLCLRPKIRQREGAGGGGVVTITPIEQKLTYFFDHEDDIQSERSTATFSQVLFLMIEFGPQNKVSKLFLKNLFSFLRYRSSKSGTSAGSIVGFTRFPKIIIGKLSSVTSQVIKAP